MNASVENAQALLQRGQFAEVSRICERLLRANDRHADARYLLALSQALTGRLNDAVRNFRQVLSLQADHVPTLANLGIALGQLGEHEAAAQTLHRAIEIDPYNASFHYALGNAEAASGNLASACGSFQAALARDPQLGEASFGLGLAQKRLGLLSEAIESFRRALEARPQLADAHAHLGAALLDRGEVTAAIASLQRSVALQPQLANAHNDLGAAQLSAALPHEAVDSFQRALALDARFAEAEANLGEALRQLGRLLDGIAAFHRALLLNPSLSPAHYGLARSLLASGDARSASSHLNEAIALDPNFIDARALSATVHEQLGDMAAAIEALQAIIAIAPSAQSHFSLAGTLHRCGRLDAAVASYRTALKIDSERADVHRQLGHALESQGRLSEAATSFRCALRLQENDVGAIAGVLSCGVRLCDASMVEPNLHRLRELPQGIEAIHPFVLLAVSDDAGEHLRASRALAHSFTERSVALPPTAAYPHRKLRIAYVSPDFREHPVGCLIAALIERHDRERFETIAISLNPPEQSVTGERLRRAFDRFLDVSQLTDIEAARTIREMEVDIAIDIAGFTSGHRSGIFASRPAPIQVSYLGFPGTLGAPYIDYILADPELVPPDQQSHYTEKVVTLPDCYQVNDSHYDVAAIAPSRSDLGLPESGFVFCCFNNTFKITPRLFAVWMRLLRETPHSVLWLASAHAEVVANLRAQAARHDIAAERLVFADRTPRREDHLARYRRADLFLDTLPFNAHATATDALWCGLPVLTCRGATFAGRVASSLLRTLDLEDLVCTNLEDYETLALELATTPALLAELRARLSMNRSTRPLFDPDRFRRHIEFAFTTMWQTARGGGVPASFSVPAWDS